MFSALSLRNIEQESLVGRNVPGNIAYRVRGFRHRANFAVFSQDIEFEVRDWPMIKEQFLEPLAIRRVCVQGRRITVHQLFARGIPGNTQESVVEVKKVSLRS